MTDFQLSPPAVDTSARTHSLRTWRRAVLVLAGCYAGGRLGLALLDPAGGAALLWPPLGIALAALLRFGPGVWPGVFGAAFIVAIEAGINPWLALPMAAGATIAPLLGAVLLHRLALHTALDRRRDLCLFGAVGVLGVAALASAHTTLWLSAGNTLAWPHAAAAWRQRWFGEALGVLLVGIPLLTLGRASVAPPFVRRRRVVTALLVAVTLLLGAALARHGSARSAADLALWFAPHLLLCVLAAGAGTFVASATALGCAAQMLVAAFAGSGPFAAMAASGGGAADAGLLLSAYLASLPAVALPVAALHGELTANARRWQLAFDASDLGVGEWDLRAGQVVFSPRWLAMLGYAQQQFGQTIQSFWARVHPDDAVGVQQAFEPLRDDAAPVCVQCRMLHRDGHWRWFELHTLVTERDATGVPVQIVTTARDIADVRAAAEQQQLSQSLFQHLHEGLLVTDAEHRVLDANPTFTQITGYGRDDVLGTVPALLQPAPAGSPAAEQQAAMRARLDADGVWCGEVLEQRRDGEPCTLQVTVSRVRGPAGEVQNHVLAMTDVTVARRQLEQLQRQAHFDELTRLPNRARLAQMLQAALDASEREGSLLTVCYLDLDHFKPVNDQFGHEAGDRLLIEVATRMRRSLRSWAGGDDVVARIGGDEFVLLLRTATLEESRHAVERVLRQVCQPYVLGLGAGTVSVTASIGATVFPLDGADAETLLRHADHAMYGAKQAGRNGYLFFDAEHDRRAEARFVALGRVQEALDSNEFRLFFQPKVDMRRAKVIGVEALLRWKHPEQGIVSPAQFLPLIENTGLSISVGNWVLHNGIEQLARWLRLGLDITLSVNVSARHLQEPLFAQHLAALLERHREPVAQRLVIEVLETTALADIDYTCGLMEACRALGVRFALDDFGTGYSTLTYLKRLPLDMLKIDRSFVTNMLHDRQDLAIVEGVIGLSQTFGCSVVAEGVETSEQAQRLIDIGCDVGQGNGIAPAMPAGEVVDWVRNYRGMRQTAALL